MQAALVILTAHPGGCLGLGLADALALHGEPDLFRLASAGEITAAGRWGPDGPLADERPIPASAWRHLQVLHLPTEGPVLQTVGPEHVRIYAVTISGAGERGANQTAAESERATEGKDAPTPVTTMMDVARRIVADDRPYTEQDHRAALARAGFTLSADGQTITDPRQTVDGEARDGRAGRKPTLARLLTEAKAEQLGWIEHAASAAAMARSISAWLSKKHPTVRPPAWKRFQALCALPATKERLDTMRTPAILLRAKLKVVVCPLESGPP